MTLTYSKFMDSDRKPEDLLASQIEVFLQISSPVYLVLQRLNSIIVDIINKDFEDLVTSSQKLNVTLNVVILVFVVIQCFIIHFLVINKLKQKENQFKRILGMFPASVVLPNFMLKSYIIKTTKQAFTLFREIA